MSEQTSPAIDAEATKAARAMGYEDSPKQSDESESKADAVKPEAGTKSEATPKTEEAKGDADGSGKDEGQGSKEDKSSSDSSEKPSTSKELKAVFSRLNEIAKDVADLKESKTSTPEEKKQAEAIDDNIKALAEKFEADPEALAELSSTLSSVILKDLEKQGLLKKDLPDDVKEKLATLDEIQNERRAEAEDASFDKEWATEVSNLRKQYPNATDAELQQAREIAFEIAHSEEGGVVIKKAKFDDNGNLVEQGKVKPYALDYIIHRNRTKFDTILKVAKANKSSETGGREMVDVEDDAVDFTAVIDTPAKAKKLEERMRKEALRDRDSVRSLD